MGKKGARKRVKMSKVSITTFNCGKLFPLHNNQLASSVIKSIIPNVSDEYDLIVLGLQEVSMIWECLDPEIMSIKIGEINKLIQGHLGNNYSLIGSDYTGGTALFLFARNNMTVHSLIRDHCKRGIINSSLKGSVSITLQVTNSNQNDFLETYCFICCHLTANEGIKNLNYRIKDIEAIIDSCKTNIPSSLFENSLLFLFGDLNFRVNPLTRVYKGDELLHLLNTHPLFKNFKEFRINFNKTYKYALYDAANSFNMKRNPSWCDRILYKYSNNENNISIESYDAISRGSSLLFSDHQPVQLKFINKNSLNLTGNKNIIKRKDFMLCEVNYPDIIISYVDWLLYKRFHYWIISSVILFFIVKNIMF